MAVAELPRIQGGNFRLTLVTEGGNISISQHTEIDFEETPRNTDSNTSEGFHALKIFTKEEAKLTVRGLRGLNNCYSDLPKKRQRIVGIQIEIVDEDGEVIVGAEDMPNLIHDPNTNPDGYKFWAVENKRGSTKDGDNADFELVLASGYLNAKS